MNTVTLLHMQDLVFEIDLNTGDVKFYNYSLVPFYLKDSIKSLPYTVDSCEERCRLAVNNVRVFTEWMELRLSVYNSVSGLIQIGMLTKCAAMELLLNLTSAVSLDDMYWISPCEYTKVNKTFYVDSVNIEQLITMRAYGLFHFEIEGIFERCRCFDNRKTVLGQPCVFPKNIDQFTVKMSRLYNLLGGNAELYCLREDSTGITMHRKCLSNKRCTFVPAIEYYKYCSLLDNNFASNCSCIDEEGFNFMLVFDYLTGNARRSPLTWGFTYNFATEKFLGIAPMTDWSGCFEYTDVDNLPSPVIKGKTMWEAATSAVNSLNIPFAPTVCRSDFLNDKHYKLFMRRYSKLLLF